MAMDKKLAALAEDTEAALTIDDELAERLTGAIDRIFQRTLERSDLDSTDRVLGLVYATKPGWSVSIRGAASTPNGHWRCTLRRSMARDNDEYIGVGRGPTLPHALLAALLKAEAFRRPDLT